MIGVSIGSQNTSIGVLKGNNVDMILSETSSRQIPTLVTFTDTERMIGDMAMSVMKSNYQRTILYPNRYLGLTNGPLLDTEKTYGFIEPVLDEYYRAAFDINFKNKNERFSPESVMAVFFNKLKLYWLNLGYQTKDIVVSVPDYYTCMERQALVDAKNIAGINCISLINESSAISLNYGLFRRTQFEGDTPRIVAFVDMGQSKTSIFFSSFTKNHQKVVSVTCERFLGARDFDIALMEFLGGIFQKKTGLNVLNKPKQRIRMIDAISKMRKILTVNKEANISIESLLDDEDINYNLTRDEFHKIIEPITNKFSALLHRAIKDAEAQSKINL